MSLYSISLYYRPAPRAPRARPSSAANMDIWLKGYMVIRRAKCLTLSIVTRAHAPRQIMAGDGYCYVRPGKCDDGQNSSSRPGPPGAFKHHSRFP